jgi:hypothetical protein
LGIAHALGVAAAGWHVKRVRQAGLAVPRSERHCIVTETARKGIAMPRHANARRLRLLGAVALSLGLSACAGTSPLELLVRAKDGVETISGNVLDTAASQIDSYCAVPLEGRQQLREALNTRTTRGDLRVTCADDPAPPPPPAAVSLPPPRTTPTPRPAVPPPPGRSMPVTR